MASNCVTSLRWRARCFSLACTSLACSALVARRRTRAHCTRAVRVLRGAIFAFFWAFFFGRFSKSLINTYQSDKKKCVNMPPRLAINCDYPTIQLEQESKCCVCGDVREFTLSGTYDQYVDGTGVVQELCRLPHGTQATVRPPKQAASRLARHNRAPPTQTQPRCTLRKNKNTIQ